MHNLLLQIFVSKVTAGEGKLERVASCILSCCGHHENSCCLPQKMDASMADKSFIWSYKRIQCTEIPILIAASPHSCYLEGNSKRTPSGPNYVFMYCNVYFGLDLRHLFMYLLPPIDLINRRNKLGVIWVSTGSNIPKSLDDTTQ